MRTLARYSFEAAAAGDEAARLAARVRDCIDGWLHAKGELQLADGRGTLRLGDGRCADVVSHEITTSNGSLHEIAVTEPTGGGSFHTSLAVAHEPGRVSVSCELSAGSHSLMPLWVDVHCPRVVRDILALDAAEWTYQGSRLSPLPRVFRGPSGGDAFIDLVWDGARAVPVIAVSEEYGLVLHPGVVEALAADLAGLAVVARLDSGASWRVTSMKGKQWSCYGGAIRLYWPRVGNGTALDHPLWTAQRLLNGVADTESAAGRIRSQIRRRILGQSAFGVAPSTLFGAIRKAAREEELAALGARIRQGDDYRAIAEEYFTKLVELNESIEARDQEIERLRAQVASLQLALRWRDETQEMVEPVEETPPATVEDAVLTARERFGDTLVFGADVNEGITTLAPDAGPPDKILMYLSALSEMTKARRKGPLGRSPLQWLAERGVSASGESYTIRNSADEMRARTWDDGTGRRREFELHLKPAEGTSPDRCVRIYFDYDDASGRSIVAWIGRHP
ncbi:MAG TPA: hypothetical protein VNK41_05015 [Vicinamibacterales bacterium]|nr:hypothetical protein [Vicinamibacterales bacterium]